MKPIEEGRADAVFGSRFLSGKSETYNILYLWGNQFLTFLVNLFFRAGITDSYTCYKAFRAPLLKKMRLVSTGFEIEAEMCCKAAFLGFRFEEVSVIYASRSRHEGKKIIEAPWGVLKILEHGSPSGRISRNEGFDHRRPGRWGTLASLA